MDNGCSRHMIGDKSKFAFLTKRKGGYVSFGNNAKGKIIGQDNTGNDTYSLIENVLLVDGLKHNILSISQICDRFWNDFWNISLYYQRYLKWKKLSS